MSWVITKRQGSLAEVMEGTEISPAECLRSGCRGDGRGRGDCRTLNQDRLLHLLQFGEACETTDHHRGQGAPGANQRETLADYYIGHNHVTGDKMTDRQREDRPLLGDGCRHEVAHAAETLFQQLGIVATLARTHGFQRTGLHHAVVFQVQAIVEDLEQPGAEWQTRAREAVIGKAAPVVAGRLVKDVAGHRLETGYARQQIVASLGAAAENGALRCGQFRPGAELAQEMRWYDGVANVAQRGGELQLPSRADPGRGDEALHGLAKHLSAA